MKLGEKNTTNFANWGTSTDRDVNLRGFSGGLPTFGPSWLGSTGSTRAADGFADRCCGSHFSSHFYGGVLNCLVVTGTMEFYGFPILSHHLGNFIIPTDFHSIIFQRGRYTTNQIWRCPKKWEPQISQVNHVTTGKVKLPWFGGSMWDDLDGLV